MTDRPCHGGPFREDSVWPLSGSPESWETALVIRALQLDAFDRRAVRPNRPTNLIRLLQEFAGHMDRLVARPCCSGLNSAVPVLVDHVSNHQQRPDPWSLATSHHDPIPHRGNPNRTLVSPNLDLLAPAPTGAAVGPVPMPGQPSFRPTGAFHTRVSEQRAGHRAADVCSRRTNRPSSTSRAAYPLAGHAQRDHPPAMFVVSEEEAAAIRAAFDQGGEFAAAVELRRRFPGITDTAKARECARTIAGWKPLSLPPRPPARLRRRSRED